MARLRLEKQAELATKVGQLMGKRVIQSRLSRWLTLSSQAPIMFFVALAKLGDVDPGWLVMGDLSEAPIPESYLPIVVKRTGQRKPPPGGGGAQKTA